MEGQGVRGNGAFRLLPIRAGLLSLDQPTPRRKRKPVKKLTKLLQCAMSPRELAEINAGYVKWMIQHTYNQVAIERRLGLNREFVRRVMDGESWPDAPALMPPAEALKV